MASAGASEPPRNRSRQRSAATSRRRASRSTASSRNIPMSAPPASSARSHSMANCSAGTWRPRSTCERYDRW